MFDQRPEKSTGPLKKILPFVALAAAGLVAAILLFVPGAPTPATQLDGMLRAGDSTYDWYVRNLKLDQTQTSLATNLSGSRAVVFSGVLHNLGEKTLDAVELKLTLFNYQKSVWESVRTALRPGGRMEAIKPLESRRLSLYVEDLPRNWFSNHAEIEIHGIRFIAEDQARPDGGASSELR